MPSPTCLELASKYLGQGSSRTLFTPRSSTGACIGWVRVMLTGVTYGKDRLIKLCFGMDDCRNKNR